LNISGGTLECTLDFPTLGNENNNGGCSFGYDRGDGQVFDLSGSGGFILDIQSVEGGMSLGITIVDANEELSLGLIENVVPGQATITLDQLLPATSLQGADLSLVDNLAFAIINQEGDEGSVVLAGISTPGPIEGGPVLPTDDDIVPEEVTGAYFNPTRDGEGCQLTLERDGVSFILSCYFYREGDQFWLLGSGLMVNGQLTIGEMTVTSGAQYGNGFDEDDVIRQNWGTAQMTWSDCNNAELALTPLLPGYEQVNLDLTRLVAGTCGGGGPQTNSIPWMGAYYDPQRDGEGFHFGIEVGEIFVMTWYTYLDGEQVWMIGTGVRDGQQVVFDDLIITSGTGFGSQFDKDEVVREPFGVITVDFSDCNNFTATVDSVLPQFHDQVLEVTKIVGGSCP